MSRDSVEITLTGTEAFYNALKEIAVGASRVEREALTAGAEVIRDEAKRNVERDLKQRTGNLRDAIEVSRITRTGTGAYIKIGLPKGTGAAYGVPVEFGHINKNDHGGATVGAKYTKAHPFMHPAYVSKKAEAYATILQYVKNAIKGV